MAHHHRGKSSESYLDKDVILRALDIQPGQTLLDAGCGNGYMSREFARALGNDGRVVALDPDEEAIAALRPETDGTCIEPLVADITRPTPLADASVDLIYLATVLHGFSADQQTGFAREVARLLKPGGRLAIVEIVKRETPFGPPQDLRFSPEELQQALPFEPLKRVDVGEYFYLQLFTRPTHG
jgi:ubiquinone/menaquinone biosynthesis C-methylase UbiE